MSRRTISTKYRKTTGKEELQIEVYYSLGGWNNFNATNEPRGYWLSISPVERDEQTHMLAFTLGRGRKKFLNETRVDRKGGKAEQEAIRLAALYEAELLQVVCREENLELAS